MHNPFDHEDAQFIVLKNEEDQYSIWPEFMTIPDGWKPVFGSSLKKDCQQYIEETWTDLRPKSLKEKLA
ncbi:MbtH family protein [Rummeliibacillus suwonensis]|jgi:MbtH protein|uniref:MbtH family protein n=1 Tax=Rummeliibacillus suwonensis TaxID=1306154 RepID=UPI001AAFBBE3|nr:MbtH family NRPS accessory protein [Rummeliibacillus suwonensis]MBO2535331.1 MbtH family NRPS accessory protein [Rummeliibacillus suwonensis]